MIAHETTFKTSQRGVQSEHEHPVSILYGEAVSERLPWTRVGLFGPVLRTADDDCVEWVQQDTNETQ